MPCNALSSIMKASQTRIELSTSISVEVDPFRLYTCNSQHPSRISRIPPPERLSTPPLPPTA